MFTKILIFLIIVLVAYYVIMIALDLYKGKLEDATKEENQEDEIDISDEVNEFQPIEITKNKADSPISPKDHESLDDEPVDMPYISIQNMSMDEIISTIGVIPDDVLMNYQHGMQPLMTDAISVEDLISEVEIMSQKGKSDLGDIIFKCQEAA